jgi:hypothetical protein
MSASRRPASHCHGRTRGFRMTSVPQKRCVGTTCNVALWPSNVMHPAVLFWKIIKDSTSRAFRNLRPPRVYCSSREDGCLLIAGCQTWLRECAVRRLSAGQRLSLTCNGCAWRVIDALYDGSFLSHGSELLFVWWLSTTTQGSKVVGAQWLFSCSDTCGLRNTHRLRCSRIVSFGMGQIFGKAYYPSVGVVTCARHMHARVLTDRVKGRLCDQVNPALCDSSQRDCKGTVGVILPEKAAFLEYWKTPNNGRTLTIQMPSAAPQLR